MAEDVEAGKRPEETAQWKNDCVVFRHGRGGLGVDERRAPAIRIDEFDEILLRLTFHAGPEHAALGVGSLPADVMEGRAGALGFEHLRSGKRHGVGNFAVILVGNLRDRSAETEKACVDAAEGFLDGRIIQKILVNESAELGVRVHERPADNGANFIDDGCGGASVKDRISDGTGGAEEKDFHEDVFMRQFDAAASAWVSMSVRLTDFWSASSK